MAEISRTSRRFWLVGLFLLALLLRLWTIAQFQADAYLGSPKADSFFFIEWARSIQEQSFWGRHLFVQSPLYPYLLALVDWLFPEPLLTMRILQALLGAASTVLVAVAAHRVTRSHLAAVLAGVLAATYAPFLFFTGLILKETLGIFLVCLFLHLVLLAAERGTARWWLAAGFALGLFWLVRANAPLLALPVLLWITLGFARGPGGPPGRRLARTVQALAFTAGLLLAVAPLTLRNLLVTGEPVLTLASGGSNFYIGNNPDAEGMYYVPPGVSADPRFEAADLVVVAGRMAGRPLTDAEASDFFVRRALHYIVSQPLDWLRLLLRKTLLYWNAFEIPDNYDFAFFAERLSPLPWLPHFPAAAVLGLLGIALPARGRAAWVLQWLILVSMLSVILFYVNDRFRVVTVPFLLVAGAVALARIHEALRQRDGRTLSACLVLSALFYALTQTSVADSERARVAAFSWARYGEHLLDSGQVPEAGEALRRAYAWNKNDKYANRGLGDVYMWSKQFERAAFHYVESVRLGLDEPDLLHKTVAALVAAHRPDIAVDFVTHTLRSEPGVREPYRLPHDFGYSPSQLTDLLPREP